jgi:catechol-2,3-dioxygenase
MIHSGWTLVHSLVHSETFQAALQRYQRRQSIIGYVTLGTNDIQKAASFFYDDLLAVIGASRSIESERFIA